MLALTAGSVASWAASLALTATNGKSQNRQRNLTSNTWLSTQDFCNGSTSISEAACKLLLQELSVATTTIISFNTQNDFSSINQYVYQLCHKCVWALDLTE